MAKYTIHFDGSCWPNPGGVAAYGYTIDGPDGEIAAVAGLVPPADVESSNNVAEFYALYEAIKALPELHRGDRVKVFGDSQIVINIMRRKWKASEDKLYYYAYRFARWVAEVAEYEGAEFEYEWIEREKNTRCDDLSKEINNAPK
jgi:ribonuclease HI